MGQKKPLKLVFMGTPELAATVMKELLGWEGGTILVAYSQPDKPAGRGMKLKMPPVKELALAHGIVVRQPRNFKAPETVTALRALEPDYLLVAAYGLILPQSVLDIPRICPLNVHTSLLPKYRGAAPIQRAIMDAETESGVSIMQMEAGLDTGPVILQERCAIKADDTAADLHDRLALMGGKLLIRAIEALEAGEARPLPQEEQKATYAAKLEKKDGALDFAQSAAAVYARMRGVSPWPGAYAHLDGEGQAEPLSVAFQEARILSAADAAARCPEYAGMRPGQIYPKLIDGKLAVRCGSGLFLAARLRPAGRKSMDAAAFMNGYYSKRPDDMFLPPE